MVPPSGGPRIESSSAGLQACLIDANRKQAIASGACPRTAHSGARRKAMVTAHASAPKRAPVRGHPLRFRFTRMPCVVSTFRWTRRWSLDLRDRGLFFGTTTRRTRPLNRGWQSMRWCVIATIVIAVACNRPAAMKIEDVHVSANSSRFIFHYRTQTPTGDCKAQAAEMPKVWVILFPEDPSGQSVAFVFDKSESGWSSPGPCPTTIPAK
jgi:hypothetical protein